MSSVGSIDGIPGDSFKFFPNIFSVFWTFCGTRGVSYSLAMVAEWVICAVSKYMITAEACSASWNTVTSESGFPAISDSAFGADIIFDVMMDLLLRYRDGTYIFNYCFGFEPIEGFFHFAEDYMGSGRPTGSCVVLFANHVGVFNYVPKLVFHECIKVTSALLNAIAVTYKEIAIDVFDDNGP